MRGGLKLSSLQEEASEHRARREPYRQEDSEPSEEVLGGHELLLLEEGVSLPQKQLMCPWLELLEQDASEKSLVREGEVVQQEQRALE